MNTNKLKSIAIPILAGTVFVAFIVHQVIQTSGPSASSVYREKFLKDSIESVRADSIQKIKVAQKHSIIQDALKNLRANADDVAGDDDDSGYGMYVDVDDAMMPLLAAG